MVPAPVAAGAGPRGGGGGGVCRVWTAAVDERVRMDRGKRGEEGGEVCLVCLEWWGSAQLQDGQWVDQWGGAGAREG